jgi:hypothetical protein
MIFSLCFLPLYLGAFVTAKRSLSAAGAGASGAGAAVGAGTSVWLQAGALVYGLGLVVETLADGQKYMFKQSHWKVFVCFLEYFIALYFS